MWGLFAPKPPYGFLIRRCAPESKGETEKVRWQAK